MTPLLTATRTAPAPHAPPSVDTSTPWSGDHVLGGATTDSGWIGKTKPCPAPTELSSRTIFCSITSWRFTSASDRAWAFGSPTGDCDCSDGAAASPATGSTACGCACDPTGVSDSEAVLAPREATRVLDPQPARNTRATAIAITAARRPRGMGSVQHMLRPPRAGSQAAGAPPAGAPSRATVP